MNLYILRHASAGTRRTNPLLDVRRPLDKEGKQHCLQLGHVLNALNISFDLIISSPLKRSLQTAQLVATEMGFESGILHSKALAPEGTLPQFQALLSEFRDRENLLLVGHSPNIQVFLGSLLVPQAAQPDMETLQHPYHGPVPMNHREPEPPVQSSPPSFAPESFAPEASAKHSSVPEFSIPQFFGPEPSCAGAQVRMRKGTLARVSYARHTGMLNLLLDPRLVRALYASSTKSSRRKTSRK